MLALPTRPLANAMPTYRVRPGVTFGSYGEKKPGDLVTLTEYEAGGFLDKLECVPDAPTQPEEPTIPTPEIAQPTEMPAEEAAASDVKPAERKTSTKRG